MQGADINSSQTTASYGSGGTVGNGNVSNANYIAGQYEYVVASGPVSGGVVPLASALTKVYKSSATIGNANIAAAGGLQTFQVVRVPQYLNLTLNGTIVPLVWNGNTGGIVALDVTGTLALGGFTIDASGAGFRGGGGRVLTTVNNGTASATVYANTTTTNTATSLNGQKGEGTAGTPYYVNAPSTRNDATTNVTEATNIDGYAGGASGRGAPGNAGGGANDNTFNSGGGGGGNGGAGGQGGNNYQNNQAIGGVGGATYATGTGTLVLGGGGGAATNNDNTGTPATGQASSGSPGGGLVLVRTGSVTGTGSILANGTNANNSVKNDGGGGGGGGGSILFTATNTPSLSTLTLSATGGSGGSNVTGSTEYGPGGGGGGGVIFTNVTGGTLTVAGGAAGTTTYNVRKGTSTSTYGAANGTDGVSSTSASNVLANSTSGSNCVADFSATITATAFVNTGQSVTAQATFANNGPAAGTPTRTVTLPAGATVTSAAGGTISVNSSGTTVTYPATSVASGGTDTYTIVYTATAAGTLTVTANVSASTDIVNTANNSASASTTVSSQGAVGTPAPCANPGKDGNVTLSTTASPNTYYPSNGNQTLAAGAKSISLGQATGATGSPIAIGDLLLVIQMQGADIDNTNASSYGTVTSNANYTAGSYEYVVAASAVPASGGTLTLTTGLANSYVNAVATTTTGQRTFQVVRVPQYSNLTLSSNISATPWNGSSGGLIVLDVANQTNLAGYTINATGAGFRGGAGRRLAGTNNAAYTNTDYRASAVAATGATGTGSTVNNTTTTVAGADGTKGEGTAGTPRYVNSTGTLLDTQTSYNGLPTSLTDGYPNGDNGRGAPANAGGGGTDGAVASNSQNAGGGGGANGAVGGRGGNTWSGNSAVGGEPGKAFAPVSTSRLVLGGGGGAGSTNDGTNDANRTGINSSGAAGGGIVMLRTATINNAGGTIVANGASASNAVANDASGGGGAGGSILVTASTASNVNYLTLNALGGTGGSNVPGGTATGHGPGGGGGGGVIFTNSTPSSAVVTAGVNGTTTVTANNATTSSAFGAAPGSDGITNTSVSPSIANSAAGATCTADVTTTITGPSTLNAGQPSGTFTAVFTNNGGSNAGSVAQTVTLPSGATLTTAQQSDLTTRYPGASYSAATGVISFPTASILVAGGSNSFTFAFTAPTAATTSATISSTVSTGANQGADVATNTASQTLTILGVADVATTISAGSSSVAVGSTVTLTANFNNTLGNTSAAGVIGQVQLPTGLGNVTTSGGTYNPATGIVTYNIGSLAAGASATALTITYTQPATGVVTAVSSVSTTTNEAGQVSNNTNSAQVSPSVTYDVATTLSGPSSATAGSEVSYNVTTSNAGTGTNTNVVQTVTLPTGATNVYATGGGVVATSSGVTTVTFPAITALGAGQAVNNTVSFTAPSASSFVTKAGVTSTQDNATGGNNASSVTTTTTTAGTGSANLYTTISPSTTSTTAGSPVTFTVTQGNSGPNAASNVVSAVSLPTGLAISGASAVQVNGAGPTSTSGNVATYANGATYNSATGLLTYNSTGISQASGATPQSYTVTIAAPASGVATATASVSSSTPDVMMSNNVASTEVTVDPAATDLMTTLTGPDQATVGQRVTYTATTSNNGPAPASGIIQRMQIVAGLPLTGTTAVFLNGAAPTSTAGSVATYTDGSTYNSSTGVVTFATTTAAQTAGGSVSNTVTYSVPNNGNASLVNSARLRSVTNDSNPANNVAAVVTTIQPSADVQVTLTGPSSATPASSTLGAPVTYGVTTTNNGGSIAGSVTTTVQLPTGLSGVVVTGYDGTVLTNSATTGYNSSTGVVTFPAVTAQPGGAAYASSGTIAFTTPAGAYVLSPTATATLTATTANSATDPNLTNNSATVVTTLTSPTAASVDLSVAVARTSGATATAGSQVVFTVTTSNASTSTASASPGVVTTVQLPAGLTSNGGTVTFNNGGTYDNATGLVTFTTTSALGINSSVDNVITISAAPGQGPLVATAAVRGNESDPTPANNTNTTSVTITNVVDVATTLSGPTVAATGAGVSYTVTTVNNGPSTATTVAQTVTLPAGIVSYSLNGGATVVLNGGSATTATTVVTLPVPATLPAGASSAVDNTIAFNAPASTTSNFPYTVMANASAGNESSSASTTNNTASVTTTRYVAPPVAAAVTNTLQSPEGNTATAAMLISPLAATAAAAGSLTYNLASIPPTTQGTLYYNNNGTYTAITGPITGLTTAQAGSLKFLPATGYVGNASFTYTAIDANNTVSNVATYLLPVGADNTATSASTTPKGNGNPYKTNDVLTYVIDANGAQYTNGGTNAGIVYDVATGTLQGGAANGLPTTGTNVVLASTGNGPSGNTANTLPSGVSLNATTGQLFVSNASQLPLVGVNTTYSVNVIVTDSNGGVSTITQTFVLGANPLPVSLVAFTAQAVQNRDAQLKWTTASELSNDHFEVERSLDGTSFVQAGQQQGQGTKATATDYSFTDAGIGARAAGQSVYYRLKQVDRNGTSVYSPVRTVSFTAASAALVGLYPNPATAATSLDLSALPAGNTYQVLLLDATGRQVRQATALGGQVQPLDLHDLATGTYHVVVSGQQAGFRQVLRLTKE